MRIKLRGVRVLGLLAFVFALAIPLLAQSDNAQISGFVKDASGAVIPGVTVAARSESRSFERSAISNDQGYYVISSLPPGFYTITAELTGFKRFQDGGQETRPQHQRHGGCGAVRRRDE